MAGGSAGHVLEYVGGGLRDPDHEFVPAREVSDAERWGIATDWASRSLWSVAVGLLVAYGLVHFINWKYAPFTSEQWNGVRIFAALVFVWVLFVGLQFLAFAG
ncbi:MAG: hypothetical protein AB1725_09080 [Armatimonadota bacterium]